MRGALHGRIAQLALMAAYRANWPVLRELVPLLAELGQAVGIEDVRQIVVYIAITTRNRERWERFAEAVRRQVPGGGELVNKADEMVEIYGEMREREGRREGQLATIEKLVHAGVAWSTIEAATGIDEDTFDRLRDQLEAADDGESRRN